jgi:hypothetical protein
MHQSRARGRNQGPRDRGRDLRAARSAAVKKGALKPHLIRYWLTLPNDDQLDAKVTDVWGVYRAAPALAARGDRVVTTDERTGVQALERKPAGLPLAPGKVERREVESLRHGTCTAILSRDGGTGQVIAPTRGPTRTEADFRAHIQGVVATDAAVGQSHFVVDNLNTPMSESLVRWVAAESDLDLDLGEKGQCGILHTQASRAALLHDSTHRIVFHDTPKQCSWLNQMEIWRSLLVRKLLKRGSFTSVDDLKAQLLGFIAYYNRTMAKPFKWTYQGKPLVA